MHFRYYAGSIGRFSKPDNVTGNAMNPQDWNLYSYVHGNPVNFSDPTGHGIGDTLSNFYHACASKVEAVGKAIKKGGEALHNDLIQAAGNGVETLGRALTVGDSSGKTMGSGKATATDYVWAASEDAGKAGTLALALAPAGEALNGAATATKASTAALDSAESEGLESLLAPNTGGGTSVAATAEGAAAGEAGATATGSTETGIQLKSGQAPKTNPTVASETYSTGSGSSVKVQLRANGDTVVWTKSGQGANKLVVQEVFDSSGKPVHVDFKKIPETGGGG